MSDYFLDVCKYDVNVDEVIVVKIVKYLGIVFCNCDFLLVFVFDKLEFDCVV